MNQESNKHRCPEPEANIVFNPLPELSWGSSQALGSARKLADYVSCEAQSAIAWYIGKKQSKKNWAQFLRVLAILATAAAGLIPVFAQIFTEAGVPIIAPAWASVALVVAVTAVGLDRFFGFSSAWMRFLTTEMQIRHALHQFLLDWELHQVKLEGRETSDQHTVQALVQSCKEFIGQVNEVLKNEMEEWVQEFRTNLAEIDKAAKAQAQVMSLGAANVKVINGDKCEQGWELSIDDAAPSMRKGKTAAIRGLMPGQHTLRVAGAIAGKAKQAEAAFGVAAGRTEEISLTLA